MKNLKLTLTVFAIAAIALAPAANAAITVVADYDFADNMAPTGFTEFGDPTYAGGKLLLDGTGDYIQATAPTTVTDNMVLEAIVSADVFGTFNFAVSISQADSLNTGYGLLGQSGNWNALRSLSAFSGSAAHGGAPTSTVAIAFVRVAGDSSLYVNGVQFNSGSGDLAPILVGAAVLSIGAHEFDAPNGLFNGSIDRVRVSTISGGFDAADLLGPGDGAAVPTPAALPAGLALIGIIAARRRR